MKIYTKNIVLLSVMAIGMIAIIMTIMPRSDHESYSYELNQPWRYPLLTAQFDMPIMRDTATTRRMRDSIDAVFVPFVKRTPAVADRNIEDFGEALQPLLERHERLVLTDAMRKVYTDGIVTPDIYDVMRLNDDKTLRTVNDGNEGYTTALTINASKTRTPMMAFNYIDSIAIRGLGAELPDSAQQAKRRQLGLLLNKMLVPNIVVDTLADLKFRNQEYLNVTGAIGIIKKGERIVDRGEIVNVQVKTNLDTYTAMLDRQQAAENAFSLLSLGQILYMAILIGLLYTYLIIYRPVFFGNLKKMVFLMSFITLFAIASILTFEYIRYGIYLVPFAMVPVVIMIFFDVRTAVISLVVTVLISALVATYPFTFIVTELCVGMFTVFSMRQLSKRSQLLKAAVTSLIAYCVCYIVCYMISYGTLEGLEPRIFGIFVINAVVLSFAYILIVVIEKLFGFISAVTLVELCDINSPLLRRMAEETPGTFQHSMQVSSLAAEAARAIGANALLVRTGALYHDIGKLNGPYFYTENQHGINPHAGLDPEISARKIISHVTEGVELASKYKLPQSIKAFITEHHGAGVARYFYNTALNNAADPSKVDISAFSYPGPNPQSKETAILMMADAVEAASRSLKEHTAENISNLVDKIIKTMMDEGMFNESPISLREISEVKETFKKRLATIYHTRIVYPEAKPAEAKPAEPQPQA